MNNCWVSLLESRVDFYSLNFGINSFGEVGVSLSKCSQDLVEKVNYGNITYDQAISELDQLISSLIKNGFPVLKYLNEQSLEQCLLSVESNPSTYTDVRLVNSYNPEDCIEKLQNKIKLQKLI